MRIAITGADGFVGKHATRVLRERGHSVLEMVGGEPTGEARTIDLRDPSSIRGALDGWNPSHVLHLAGASSVARSHESPRESFEVNTTGTVNLLDAIRHAAPSARVLVVSSGEVYGNLGRAAVEGDVVNPTSPYAASKLAAEVAARQFSVSYEVSISVARPFNHIGPGQASHFAIPSFARQLMTLKREGGARDLRVGNLEAVRDFLHVLDVVDAYEILLERGANGDAYNIGSGNGRSLAELLRELITLAEVDVNVVVDPALQRPIDIPTLVAVPKKMESLGWRRSRNVRLALQEVLQSYV